MEATKNDDLVSARFCSHFAALFALKLFNITVTFIAGNIVQTNRNGPLHVTKVHWQPPFYDVSKIYYIANIFWACIFYIKSWLQNFITLLYAFYPKSLLWKRDSKSWAVNTIMVLSIYVIQEIRSWYLKTIDFLLPWQFNLTGIQHKL